MSRRAALRLALPPLAALAPGSRVCGALRGRDGSWAEGAWSLAEAGQRWPGGRVQAVLHADDLILVRIAVPPLTGARLRAAVRSEVEALMLDDPGEVALAHGPRGSDGRVSVAWVSRTALARAAGVFASCGLVLDRLYPTPFFLPAAGDGWTAQKVDVGIVVRCGEDMGFVQPAEAMDDATLSVLVAAVEREAPATLDWIGAPPQGLPGRVPVPVRSMPAGQAWSGHAPDWSLPVPATAAVASPGRWRKPLLWCAAALVVGLGGLNLYAARLAMEGERLRAQMAQQVMQAFPSLPSVIDPLQQARRQVAAERAGAAAGTTFAALATASATALPFLAGQVQELRYAPGQLVLRSRERSDPGAPKATEPPPWASAAQAAGMQVEATDDGWHIRQGADASPAPAEGNEPGGQA
ncbi:type II secretion system protein GspL [[Pseudomonas] boreopolis]|uniref:type II secretion system protein GspL n=1 Tax=Xanthomonas boreopolis TaxID=86183 RepID=UPI003D9AC91B